MARVVSPIEASTRNDSFLVADAGDRRYVLRRHRRNAEGPRVRFQLRFQQHLLSHSFPTSEILGSKLGDPLVAHESGLWVLFAFVEGSEYDFSRMGQVREAARRLAEFHSVADSFEEDEVVFDANGPGSQTGGSTVNARYMS